MLTSFLTVVLILLYLGRVDRRVGETPRPGLPVLLVFR